MTSSTFDVLIADLTRDAIRARPKDALQFCSTWFQCRLEEQRVRTRDNLSERMPAFSFPKDLYEDIPIGDGAPDPEFDSISPFTQPAPRTRASRGIGSIANSPFGTLNVPGNALLVDEPPAPNPMLAINGAELASPLTERGAGLFTNPFAAAAPVANSGSESHHASIDYLSPMVQQDIFARRASVCAESIDVDKASNEALPVYTKSPEQIRRIKASIERNFLFKDLDEEQEIGVIMAMREVQSQAGEVVIRQGDHGDYFYVVESGLLHCYINPGPLPASWQKDGTTLEGAANEPPAKKFTEPDHHEVYGKKVAENRPGTSFGELALMYGHPRAATVLSIEPSTMWSLDRITFRTIILKAAHRRRTMYEQFLSNVPLLYSLSAEEKSKIADALVSSVYEDGEHVVRQGETGDKFFFIEDGEAVVTKTSDLGEDKVVARLSTGQYFGELALLRLEPRAATVSAAVRQDRTSPRLKVAALDFGSFTRLLGPLKEIMQRHAGEYNRPRGMH